MSAGRVEPEPGEQRFFSCGFGQNPMGLPFSDRADLEFKLIQTFSFMASVRAGHGFPKPSPRFVEKHLSQYLE